MSKATRSYEIKAVLKITGYNSGSFESQKHAYLDTHADFDKIAGELRKLLPLVQVSFDLEIDAHTSEDD